MLDTMCGDVVRIEAGISDILKLLQNVMKEIRGGHLSQVGDPRGGSGQWNGNAAVMSPFEMEEALIFDVYEQRMTPKEISPKNWLLHLCQPEPMSDLKTWET